MIFIGQITDGVSIVHAFLTEAGPWAAMCICFAVGATVVLIRIVDKFEKQLIRIESAHADQLKDSVRIMDQYADGLRQDREAFISLIREMKQHD